jgi:DNA ligase 1
MSGVLKKTSLLRRLCFDILYLNKRGLLGEDTLKRVEMLERIDTEGGIQVAETLEVKSASKLRRVFDEKVGQGYEGLIVKQKKGAYLPGSRNFEWIKLKKSMLKGLVDSIDLVAVGYNLGSGRRKNLGVGSVLGAIYDQDRDCFVAICNVGTGFNDEQLSDVSKSLGGDSLHGKPKNVVVEKSLEPDIWVNPKVVFTVEADEISKKKDSENLSLRFPRLIEWGRDKEITEATTVEELKKMYKISI